MGKWQFTMDPVQEWGEEVEDGAIYGVTLHREPIQPPPDTAENDSAFGFMQYRTLKVRRLKAATMERLVTELVNPECHDPDYMQIFLSTYRAFTCTDSLLEHLFQREDMVTNLDNSVCVRSALPPLIRLWLDEYHEDLRDSPDHQALRLLCVHLRHRLCFRRLVHQADALLKRFQMEDKHIGVCATAEACGTDVEKPVGEETMERRDIGEMGNVLDFPAEDIAEQLTLLDAELFVKVIPFHCLGCIWSQRDKKENRNLAPTVRATIAQFNAVTNCVITSLLCRPAFSPSGSPVCPKSSPTQRAKIIEKWISVAQECRQLRNFSSLRAILSALQSNAVYRLKKTWAAISRESMATFDHLCETFPDENCVLVNRDILVEVAEVDTHSAPKSPRLSPTSKHTSSTNGEVPYLGTYLTVLTMLDTALGDIVEGGLINFEKRRKEFEILSQIRQLQASCAQYNLQSNPRITSWINSGMLLSDQKSYELSRELEPPVDPCPSSPNLWSHRLITKKLTSLLSGSENFTKKTFADQISVSSSGSSGSEMEDLTNISPLRYKVQSPSVSCQDVSVDTSTFSLTPPTSLRRSLQPDLSALDPDSPSPLSSSSSLASSSSLLPSSSSSPLNQHSALHPVYNKQIADSCIVRVSVEFGNNGNVYKSILITSQDKTAQVIQRALEKHNLEEMNCQDFSLTQVLSNDKELLIPDKANVFYAMCTTANYDFVLRQHYKNHCRGPGATWSPGAVLRGRK
ncbi:ral guanine nucleotide dissociation stimulator-like 1 isoform X1 [Myxocyprinus asiaticus]|uniref:ral guanine nucleotide dissociation stimulator-like 1 isoform X1 n=2 Tax=Myxocyprinus asiaticus TaxID=70543 RepID=UPI002223CE77|nr:ral guanine nucleotide dissociation stimulator-like 1 isoform X1 [Myxocyprinus asiaticus]